jgi:hypothetical protein
MPTHTPPPGENNSFYLDSSCNNESDRGASSVFDKVKPEPVAKYLYEPLTKEEYAGAIEAREEAYTDKSILDSIAIDDLSEEEEAKYDAQMERIAHIKDEILDEYYLGIEKEIEQYVQYTARAQAWIKLLRDMGITDSPANPQESSSRSPSARLADRAPQIDQMDWRNAGLNLLWLFAQGYYKLLESVIGCPCGTLDIELNTFHHQLVKNIRTLLKNHEDLRDFPEPFEPAIPDLCPSTLCHTDWNTVAPKVEKFFSAAHKYVLAKDMHDPAPGSFARILIETFEPELAKAVEKGTAYRKRMFEISQQRRDAANVSAPMPPATHAPTPMPQDLLEQILKYTKLIPSFQQKIDEIPQQTAAHLAPRLDSLGHEFADLQQENVVLKQNLAQMLANLAQRVDPEFFQWVYVIMGTGSVNAAAQKLKIKQTTFHQRFQAYVARGGLYRMLYKMLGIRRKGVGQKSMERYNEALGEHQRGIAATATDEADWRQMLDGLEDMNPKNWSAIRDELIELVREMIM